MDLIRDRVNIETQAEPLLAALKEAQPGRKRKKKNRKKTKSEEGRTNLA